jgi:hypothetical protein
MNKTHTTLTKLFLKKLKPIGIKLILCFLIPASTLNAGILNVITNSDTSKIKINKENIATGTLTNYNLNNGSYFLEILQDQAIIYSKLITINDKVKTVQIDIERNPLKIDTVEQMRLRAKLLIKEKPKFGIGFHFDFTGASNGLKLAYDTGKIEHQIIGFLYETSNNTYNSLKYRALHYFPGQLNKGIILRPYTGLGAGFAKETQNNYSTNRYIYEAILGLQFRLIQNDTKMKFTPVDAILGVTCFPLLVIKKGAHIIGASQNIFFNVETGYTIRNTKTNDPNAWGNYKGLKLGADVTYHF